MKTFYSVLACVLLAAGLCHAFGSAAGKWDCVATSSTGEKIGLTLEVKEDSGALSGMLVLESGERLPLVDAKADADRLTFKINLNGDAYQIDLKIAGDKISGKYSGKDASGTVEGGKKA